jgi:hypothetical protein
MLLGRLVQTVLHKNSLFINQKKQKTIMKNFYLSILMLLFINSIALCQTGFGGSTPSTAKCYIDSVGDIIKIKGLDYSWPASYGSVETVLKNNSGILNWVSILSLLNPGTGIDFNGNTITNSMPDLPITLNGTSPIVVTGTYPNFTVAFSGSAGIAGTGITNNIPKFTGSSTLGASLINDNGSNVIFNATSPNSSNDKVSSIVSSGRALAAYTNNGAGIHAENSGSGSGNNAIEAISTNSSASLTTALYGQSTGSNGNGAFVRADLGANAIGLWALCPLGINSGYSLYCGGASYQSRAKIYGNLAVTGSISKASGSFLIDHPLDPANRYLYHSFVESPDMMNIYNGNIITDDSGIAVVKLPNYFDSLNIDFKYQLTTMGKPALAYILEEISNNEFIIKTNCPNIKVSWQVTGVRNDNYARMNRIIPEIDKKAEDKGKYLHPECFGFGPENFIDFQMLKEKEPKISLAKNPK